MFSAACSAPDQVGVNFGVELDFGPVPARFAPVFRDRDDLPAAGNLNDEIQAAIAGSHFLIVLCSPNAAASRWVNEEIRSFKALGRGSRILCLIVGGEPGAAERQQAPDDAMVESDALRHVRERIGLYLQRCNARDRRRSTRTTWCAESARKQTAKAGSTRWRDCFRTSR